ncbi:MAG: DinB family protein [Pirellulaceae bacterium]
MSIAAHVVSMLALPDLIVRRYLEDLTNDDLLVRPYANMNHIAWQLGHLIASENAHVNQVFPDSMPALPAEFAAKHSNETAASDERSRFYTKSEYINLMGEQRNGSIAVLKELTDEQLSRPSPESLRYFGPTVSSIFAGESAHWMMHAGQWAVVRRKLGKPPLF